MANSKISALSAAAALGGTEEIPGVQSAANVKLTPAQISTYVTARDGALVGLTATLSAVDMSSTYVPDFSNEVYDDNGYWEGVTNPERLTVPANGDYVLKANIRLSGVAASEPLRFSMQKNGGFDDFLPFGGFLGESTISGLSLVSPRLTLVSGDYFNLWLDSGTDTSINILLNNTWFEIQRVG
tara:strand:+ start:10521 stop:11072 length:552 start_codon:yes stop_codon:yes gene_type:complete